VLLDLGNHPRQYLGQIAGGSFLGKVDEVDGLVEPLAIEKVELLLVMKYLGGGSPSNVKYSAGRSGLASANII
jgi:hypothetical protein